MLVYLCKDSHIESSHSLHENDGKFQTYPPSTLHVKMPNLTKIDVYNFRYKISVGMLMKLSFLSHKCINKLVHEQIYIIYYTHALSCAYFSKLQIIIRLKC